MTSPIDPAAIRLTGENSFIRLSPEPGGEQTTRTSHWRVLWTPAGAGHVLFLKSADLDGDQVRVYSDNIAMTRYVQEEIESMLFPEFGDTNLPVINARFRRSGGIESAYNEIVAASTETVVLSWHDFLTPYMLNNPAGEVSGRTHCVYSSFFPARQAHITVGDRAPRGEVPPEAPGSAQRTTVPAACSARVVLPRRILPWLRRHAPPVLKTDRRRAVGALPRSRNLPCGCWNRTGGPAPENGRTLCSTAAGKPVPPHRPYWDLTEPKLPQQQPRYPTSALNVRPTKTGDR